MGIVSDFEAGLKTNIVADDMMMDDVVEMMNVTPMGPSTEEVIDINMSESDDDNDVISDQTQVVFQALPKSISDVKLEFHHTARLTLDDNGVKDMLNIDEKSEREEYEEGNIGDDETTK